MIKALYISPELVKAIEDLRRGESPIPSWSRMACRLIQRGLSASRTLQILRYCDQCGRDLKDLEAAYCDHCGREIVVSL